MKNKIKDFLANNEQEFISVGIPNGIYGLKEVLSELSYEMDDLVGEETNGWQIDFWYGFSNKEGKTLCLSGSLFYGDFKLTKD